MNHSYEHSLNTTSERHYVQLPPKTEYGRVAVAQKSTGWGTGVVGVKWADRKGGVAQDFTPALTLGPPATGTAVQSPLWDFRAVPFLVIDTTTAESGEFVQVTVTTYGDAE